MSKLTPKFRLRDTVCVASSAGMWSVIGIYWHSDFQSFYYLVDNPSPEDGLSIKELADFSTFYVYGFRLDVDGHTKFSIFREDKILMFSRTDESIFTAERIIKKEIYGD